MLPLLLLACDPVVTPQIAEIYASERAALSWLEADPVLPLELGQGFTVERSDKPRCEFIGDRCELKFRAQGPKGKCRISVIWEGGAASRALADCELVSKVQPHAHYIDLLTREHWVPHSEDPAERERRVVDVGVPAPAQEPAASTR